MLVWVPGLNFDTLRETALTHYFLFSRYVYLVTVSLF